ncbi:hypothetical protein IFM89_009655 [Coptis chinensis]|uniref:RNA helicase n=1 Tax=Coptis chinensis TaxID=261450 RepID=A0A835IQM6_9MAGN|nr:hypothetical protein IFM89_009655 [Coptis chinensis]
MASLSISLTCFSPTTTGLPHFLPPSKIPILKFPNTSLISTTFSPSQTSLPISCVPNTVEIAERALTLREICEGHVPKHILQRKVILFFLAEEVGFVEPTDVQREALPILLSGRDCILHAQTGSGKTLAYLLLIFSVINVQRSTVQALIVVPTRELGTQVAKVARMLAAKPVELELEGKTCTVMALLDGGMLKRHKSWLKAEPPTIVVATMGSLFQMLEKHLIKLETLKVLVIDEVDFMFNSSKEVSSLRKLLTSYSSINSRQTVLASASIPQHRRFLYDCIQQKWTKNDVVHVHVNPVDPMPSRVLHKFVQFHLKKTILFVIIWETGVGWGGGAEWFTGRGVHCPHHGGLNTVSRNYCVPFMESYSYFQVCDKNKRLQTLLSLLEADEPKSGIIFVGEQSEKSKKAGNDPSTTLVINFLITSYNKSSEILLLEEDMNFNSRATSLSEVRQGGGCLLVATDIAARGVDLPETTHIYNFDLPRSAVDYLHRAGRTGRKPFSDEKCTVTNMITAEERFALQRFENELMFQCEELSITS